MQDKSLKPDSYINLKPLSHSSTKGTQMLVIPDTRFLKLSKSIIQFPQHF